MCKKRLSEKCKKKLEGNVGTIGCVIFCWSITPSKIQRLMKRSGKIQENCAPNLWRIPALGTGDIPETMSEAS